ncbi:DUF6527 family protein [Pseudarthrobacter sp. alpha12b]
MTLFQQRGNLTQFWCPGCDDMHQVSDSWDVRTDNGLLTIAPSVLVLYGSQPGAKRCHSFVNKSRIEFLQDCTHDLAGGSTDLDPLPEWLVKEAEGGD